MASLAPVAASEPTLADTPINPILWAIIGFLCTLLLGLCAVVIGIVKSQFNAIKTSLESFQAEIMVIKNDIIKLQHGQDIFSKDLEIKDMKIENIRLKNKLHEDK